MTPVLVVVSMYVVLHMLEKLSTHVLVLVVLVVIPE